MRKCLLLFSPLPMHFRKSDNPQKVFSISTSVLVHALLLYGAYCWAPSGLVAKASSAKSSYSIRIGSAPTPPSSISPEPQDFSSSHANSPKLAPTHTKLSPKKQALKSKKAHTPPKPSSSAPKDTTPKQKHASQAPKQIDKRGLYTKDTHSQAGAVLEMVGWTWDAVPQPKDETEESGKLVFEIKIDDLGEVIAVRTLEKTVSPVVERLYKDALAALTFSKTSDNTTRANVSTGKVTFILRTK